MLAAFPGTVKNCTFADNKAGAAGAILNETDNTILNTIFVNNSSAVDGGGTVNYCHFYDNPDSDYNGRTGADAINALPGCANNQDGDPKLTFDLHLRFDSPCINTADPALDYT
ncbi:unnamed protein product, partial [marine sediment metagenome]